MILPIDPRPFYPSEFSIEYRIWQEPGNIRQEIPREIDFSKVTLFESCLTEKETRISGEEKLKRLLERGFICLDGRVFRDLWLDYCSDKMHSVLEWLWTTQGIRTLYFLNPVVCSLLEDRLIFCFRRIGRAEWKWKLYPLSFHFYAEDPVALLGNTSCPRNDSMIVSL